MHYGATIPTKLIFTFFAIKLPNCLQLSDCKELQLLLHGRMQYIRDKLLTQGMYLKKRGVAYHILECNETHNGLAMYVRKAYNALSRAKTLNDNAPEECMPNKVLMANALNNLKNDISGLGVV